MPIEERLLRAVHFVVEHSGVRNAADHLQIDPSVVSRAIAGAERSTGLTLFQRHGRRLEPTQAALALHGFYKELVMQRADLDAKLDDIRGLRFGSVAIGVSEGFVEGLFEGPLARFRTAYPAIGIELLHLPVDEIVRRVAESEIDLGLAHNPPPHDGVAVATRQALPIALIVPAGHALAGLNRPVSVQELIAQPLALVSSGYGLRRAVEILEFMHHVQVRPVFTTNGLASLRAFVTKGLGTTLLPAKMMRREIERGQVVALEIDDIVFRSAEAQLLVRKGRRLSLAAAKMSRLIGEHLEQL